MSHGHDKNEVKIKMAKINAELLKCKIDLNQVSAHIGVQEKESIISVRY